MPRARRVSRTRRRRPPPPPPPQIRQQLSELKLDDATVWAREEARKKRGEGVVRRGARRGREAGPRPGWALAQRGRAWRAVRMSARVVGASRPFARGAPLVGRSAAPLREGGNTTGRATAKRRPYARPPQKTAATHLQPVPPPARPPGPRALVDQGPLLGAVRRARPAVRKQAHPGGRAPAPTTGPRGGRRRRASQGPGPRASHQLGVEGREQPRGGRAPSPCCPARAARTDPSPPTPRPLPALLGA
jgi:hypothetical protein